MRAFLTLTLLMFVFVGPVLAKSMENNSDVPPPGDPVPADGSPVWQGPLRAVLYDNGPYFNSPGTGFGGADESILQTVTFGMNTLGFGHQIANDNRVADDFVAPAGQTWDISSITFFAYQTGSPTTSTINAVHFEIWDGVPGASTLLFGDMATNRLVSSAWTNCYRVSETTTGTATNRPIMANFCSPMGTLQLTEGQYWVAWQTGGTLTSGPWAPPIAILGQPATGDGLQSIAGGSYAPVTDSGNSAPQGFPFVIEGSTGPVSVEPTTWAGVKSLYR